MEHREGGFTLVEMCVVIGIVVMLLAAGGWMLFSMHPGTLRASVNQYDNAMAVIKTLAPSTGNGATVAFLPRYRNGQRIPGFVMKLYRGRPSAPNAVTDANIDSYTSDSDASERTFGSVPFALFFNSAARATGVGNYPHIDAHGNATFPVIATQPDCPRGGIALTFRSPQGATDTRTLDCDFFIYGQAPPNPSPTPNRPGIAPYNVTAYYTTNAPQLTFITSEFGYTHWFETLADNCAGIAQYPSNYPYSQPQDANETTRPDPAPLHPYSWPNNNGGSMNNAPAKFLLQPVAPGTCDAQVADQFGQSVTEHVRVMGDLSLISMNPQPPANVATKSIKFGLNDGPVTITVGKTFDNLALRLGLGGSCGGFNTAGFTKISAYTADQNPTSTATASFTIAPNGNAGHCDLVMDSQYGGDPYLTIHVDIAGAQMRSWPAYALYAANGGTLASAGGRSHGWNVAATVNEVLGGGTASAAGTCPAKAYSDASMMSPDVGLHIFPGPAGPVAVTVQADGCYNGSLIAYEPDGSNNSFYNAGSTCGTSLKVLGASGSGIAAASFPTVSGAPIAACTVMLQDSVNSAQGQILHGLVNVSVMGCNSPTMVIPIGQTCLGVTPDWANDGICPDVLSWISGPGNSLISKFASVTVSNNMNGTWNITRISPGTATLELVQDKLTGIYMKNGSQACTSGKGVSSTITVQ